MWLANNGNYREMRYFTPWAKHRQIEDHYLPRMIQGITGQVCIQWSTVCMLTDWGIGKSTVWRRRYQHHRHVYWCRTV